MSSPGDSPGSSPGSDVEFLEPDGSVSPPEAPPAPRVRRVSRSWLALVLAAIGAALAVVAPFTRAFRIRFTALSDAGLGGFSIDGWGRYGHGDHTVSHGARLGVLFCVAAGLVLLAMVAWLTPARRGDGWRRMGSGAVVFAAGAVLAVAVGLWLSAQAARDSYEMALHREIGGDAEPRSANPVELSLGPLLWLAIASAVLLIAAVLVHPRDRAAGVDEPAPPPPPPSAPLHRDDEVLGG